MASPEHLKVFIMNPKAVDGDKRLSMPDDDLSWIYFGRDVPRFYRIRNGLFREGKLLNSGELINQIAEEIEDDLINFDKHLDVDVSHLLWQMTDLADKNPYTSDFSFHCCAFLAFHRIIQTLHTNCVAFVEDDIFGLELARHARKVGVATRHLTGNRALDCFPDWLKLAYYQFKDVARGIYHRFLFIQDVLRWKKLIRRNPRPNKLGNEYSSHRTDVILTCWSDADAFQNGRKKIPDPFWGELPKILQRQGKTVAYLATPMTWVSSAEEIYENIKSSEDPVLLPQECLQISDMISLTWRTLFPVWRIKSSFVVQGVDLTSILALNAKKERAKARQCFAGQFYYVGLYLRKHGVAPATLLHTYENQPWEKALRAGIKHHLPQCKVVGYQHSPFPKVWLGPFPSRREIRARLTPDLLVVLGRTWKKVLTNHGYPDAAITTGPALRYNYFDETGSADSIINPHTPRGGKVLVASSIGYSDSFELLVKSIGAFRNLSGIPVLIKLHPRIDHEAAVHLLDSVLQCLAMDGLPGHVSVTERPVSELLCETGLLLHNGTSVALEAMAYGIEQLLVKSDLWFDMAYEGFTDDPQTCAGSPEAIRSAALTILTRDEHATADRVAKARAAVRELFLPVTENTLEAFSLN